jgi:hypothetical protein
LTTLTTIQTTRNMVNIPMAKSSLHIKKDILVIAYNNRQKFNFNQNHILVCHVCFEW